MNGPTTARSAGGVVTLSAGVAAAEPAAGGSPADLLAATDRALYRAKRSGRNIVVVEEETEAPRRERVR